MNVKDTLAYIKIAHTDQFDKSGAPYWTHPVSVMLRLGEKATDDERRVALLHDVLEDTKITLADLIVEGFSLDVILAVHLLTRPSDLQYLDWIKMIALSGNKIAIKVKVADLEDNLDPARLARLGKDERTSLTKRYEDALAILRGIAGAKP